MPSAASATARCGSTTATSGRTSRRGSSATTRGGTRKLLLKKREINRFLGKAVEKGATLVPLAVYFKRGWAKVDLGVARGKREFDKREDLKARESRRDIDREMKRRRKSSRD